MQATARRLSVVSATPPARRRLIRNVRLTLITAIRVMIEIQIWARFDFRPVVESGKRLYFFRWEKITYPATIVADLVATITNIESTEVTEELLCRCSWEYFEGSSGGQASRTDVKSYKIDETKVAEVRSRIARLLKRLELENIDTRSITADPDLKWLFTGPFCRYICVESSLYLDKLNFSGREVYTTSELAKKWSLDSGAASRPLLKEAIVLRFK